jgi:alkylation response protein AidB-like acyl-CoA dehydrogenase
MLKESSMTLQRALHPSHFIDSVAAERISRLALEAEQLGQLHPLQLAEIYRHRWFQLFVPGIYGGLERSLPEGIQIQEGLAWADGSTAMVVTLCSGAGWFGGFLAPEIAKTIFSDPKVCLAGSGQPSGTAVATKNGYHISGHWDYASGAPHATAFTANCLIQNQGTVPPEKNGNWEISAFIFLKEEVRLLQNWKTIGMVATASDSFEVKGLLAREERRFIIDPAHAIFRTPLYLYPFLQLAEATLAVNSSGMAMKFLDLSKELFSLKNKTEGSRHLWLSANEQLEQAYLKLDQLRQSFYRTLHASWEACILLQKVPEALCKDVSGASRSLAIEARQLVDELYPYCGMKAANPTTPINQVWRNLHTASQHSLLRAPL